MGTIKFNKSFYTNILFGLIGLVIVYYFIASTLVTPSGIILKNDYIDQHIPFYEEFYRLLENGLPFWSWNSFLGTDFWSSKIYYLVGDLYAWIGFILYQHLKHVIRVLTRLLYIKFFVAYLGFYWLQLKLGQKSFAASVFSLFYVFLGWNTTFIEHPSFTSLFSIVPYLFVGVEHYLDKKQFSLFTFSVFLLVSMNFYLFWVVSLMLLVYWIARFIVLNEYFKPADFLMRSIKLLGYFLLGLGLAAVFIIPGVLHLSQSTRISSSLLEYSNWSDINIASFISFTLVPRLAYFQTGLYKDSWYYFEQVSIYFGVFSLMLLPHTFYVFNTKKEQITYGFIVLLLPILLMSPKIGLFFHFTYSLRYTLLISFFGLLISSLVFINLKKLKLWVILSTQVLISFAFYLVTVVYLNKIYGSTYPEVLIELDLLHLAHQLSFLYSAVLILMWFSSRFKKNSTYIEILKLVMLLIGVFELIVMIPSTLQSHLYEDSYYPEYYNYTDFVDAVNFIKELDSSFYRIEHNGLSFSWFRFENSSLVHDFHSTVTYDSVYQYTLSDFLKYYKQYPATSWHFRFSEPTFYNLLNAKYAIIHDFTDDSMVGDYFAYPVENGRFGSFQVYQYKDVSYSARSYSTILPISQLDEFVKEDDYNLYEVSELMDSNLYVKDEDMKFFNSIGANESIQKFITSDYGQNFINYEFELSDRSAVLFSIPYDRGWTVKDQNGNFIEVYNVHGGFIGIILDAGSYQLNFEFVPYGFDLSIFISILSILIGLFVIIMKLLSIHVFKKAIT